MRSDPDERHVRLYRDGDGDKLCRYGNRPGFHAVSSPGDKSFPEGPITSVTVLNGGSDCSPNVTLEVNDISGTGAVLTPTIEGGVITAVTVTNGGQDYQNPVVSLGNQGTGASATITVTQIEAAQIITVTLLNGGSNFTGTTTTSTLDGYPFELVYTGPLSITPASGGTGVKFVPTIVNGVITSIAAYGLGTGYTNGDSLVFTNAAGSGASFRATVTPSGNYPSCATYFQQRKVFAGSNSNPQTLWMTRPADFKNMDISNPSQASDAIVATIASCQVNAIKWLVSMNNLVLLSSGGAWILIGGPTITAPQAVTPTNTVVVQQNYVGCADLPPIVINYDILYVQSKGSIVRDLAYNFWVNVYTGTDMSVLAQHLFFGHNMERWAYAEQPFYQVWIVRDDGMLLSFTYLKEQDVYAWAHHDSLGNFGALNPGVAAGVPGQPALPAGADRFMSVASIPEQQIPGINVDSVYFVVQRTIPGINGGNPVQCVERMNARNFLTNGVSDVTKAWFVDCGLQYSGSPATEISGLDHLNGATVSILADGSVQPQQVVVNGTITLQNAASLVTAGLGYVAQLPDPLHGARRDGDAGPGLPQEDRGGCGEGSGHEGLKGRAGLYQADRDKGADGIG